MAFFTPSCLISEIRGSVGNQTFSRNAHGNIVKQKLVQTNPDTAAQQTVRANMAAAVEDWQELTDSQRREFYDMAKDYPRTDSLGRTYVSTGYHFYIRTKLAYRSFGQFYFNYRAKKKQTLAPTLVGITESMTGMQWSLVMPAVTYTRSWAIFATDQISPGIKNPNPSTFKLIKWGTIVTSTTSDATANWEAVYGAYTPDPDRPIWFRFQILYRVSAQIDTLPLQRFTPNP
jgi:hypothetical protein